MHRVRWFVAAAMAMAWSNPADAQDLRYELALDVPIAVAAGAAWGVTELLKSDLGPSHCRWCDDNGLDREVRHALKWNDTHTACTISDVLGLGGQQAAMVALGVLSAAHDDRAGGVAVDLLVVAEATLISGSLNQLAKYTVARARPFARSGLPGGKATLDDNLSFYSAHTSTTMAAAVATGTVASMRGYRWAPIVWAFGPTLSLVTGYLRVAADQHWFTDVIAGAALGAAVGFALPYFFHRPGSGMSAGTGSTSTTLVSMSGVF
jgi:membrane-associated phospholipid phosphatase